ncbi:hypothetical protein [Actinoplanes sp. HUAS TT8]|uniref:hypothetical protein n=1 Tax=Actinoplanes sp. HUAS TT8 TaxID=3447453 RepID=UPI003F51EF1E
MPENDLTPAQRFVLLVLMGRASSLPNAEISNSLKADKRNDLVKRELIEVTGKPMQLELTQKGHDRALRELAGPQPERSGAIGLALYTYLRFVDQLIEATGIEPRALFQLRDLHRVIPATQQSRVEEGIGEVGDDLDGQVRKIYAELVGRPGGHVMLADLRDSLPGVERSELDATLVRMNRSSDVHITPESNQKSLTARERAGAVSIGNQERHLIAIVS